MPSLLALLATLNLVIAGQPWGVVYGFGLWAAKIANATGAMDVGSTWFWSQPGNALRLSETVLLDVTSITNIGILAGALWVSASHTRQQQAFERQAMGRGADCRPGAGLQLAPGVWLQRGRHVLGHLHRLHPRLDLGAAGVCRHQFWACAFAAILAFKKGWTP